MNFKTDFLTAISSANEWSGAYTYRPPSHNDFFRFGEMFAVMRLATEVSDFDLERFAKLLMQEIQEYYFEKNNHDSKESTTQVLEAAVRKMKSRMEVVLSKEDKVANAGIDIELVLTISKDDYLYIVIVGESKLHILRERELVDVSESIASALNGSNFLTSGSLILEEQDRIIMLTSKAFNLGSSQLENVLQNLDLDILIDLEETPGVSLFMFASESASWPEYGGESDADEEQVVEDETITLAKNVFEKESQKKAVHEEKEKEELLEKSVKQETKSTDSRKNSDFEKITPEEKEVNKEVTLNSKLSNQNKEDEENLKKATNENPTLHEHLSQKETLTDSDLGDATKGFSKERYSELSKEAMNKSVDFISTAAGKTRFAAAQAKKRFSNHFKENQTTYAHIIQTAISFIANIFNKFKSFFRKNILGDGVRQYSQYQKRKLRRNRLIFAVVLVACAYFLYTNINSAAENNRNEVLVQERRDTLASFQQEFQSYSTTLPTSSNRSTLGNQLSSLLTRTENYISSETTMSAELRTEFEALVSQIENSRNSVLKINSFTQPQVIADIGAQFPDANLSDIEYSNGSIFVSDQARNVIYKLGTQLQSTINVHITGLSNPNLLIKNAANDIIFYDTNSTSAVGRFNPDTPESVTRFAGLTLSNVGNVDEVGLFENNDALYEIHNTNNQIFKRDKNGLEYFGGGAVYESSNPPNWKTAPEIGRGIDIAVPFEIYMLAEGQGLFRYLGGGDNTISPSIFTDLTTEGYEQFKQATALDVSFQFMAVGVPSEKKVMLFSIQDTPEKPMALLTQFQYQGVGNTFAEIEEIIINEVERELYVLDGEKVIRLDFSTQ